MAKPSRFRIEYAPQQKKQLQARCAFCRKHFKQNKLRIGTKLPSGDIQWRHTNRKCRAWQYVLARADAPEEFDGWEQIKALDKKKVRRFFVPKTKKRIITRETTVTKLPGAEKVERMDLSKEVKPEEQPTKVQEKRAQKNENVKEEDEESEDSDENDSSDEEESKLNGKAVAPTASKDNELTTKCKAELERQIKEIHNVFAKGMDKAALTKAKDLASGIVAMTTVILHQSE